MPLDKELLAFIIQASYAVSQEVGALVGQSRFQRVTAQSGALSALKKRACGLYVSSM